MRLIRLATNSTVTGPSSVASFSLSNSGTNTMSLASSASMVSASVTRPGTSSEVATQTADSESQSARTTFAFIIRRWYFRYGRPNAPKVRLAFSSYEPKNSLPPDCVASRHSTPFASHR